MKWTVVYVVGNAFKEKIVDADNIEQARRRARVKTIQFVYPYEPVETKHWIKYTPDEIYFDICSALAVYEERERWCLSEYEALKTMREKIITVANKMLLMHKEAINRDVYR